MGSASGKRSATTLDTATVISGTSAMAAVSRNTQIQSYPPNYGKSSAVAAVSRNTQIQSYPPKYGESSASPPVALFKPEILPLPGKDDATQNDVPEQNEDIEEDEDIDKKFGDTLRISMLKMVHWKTVTMSDIEEFKKEVGSDDWWRIVDRLTVKTPPEVKPLLKRKNWKTVRLFVSSTFKDMHFEREHLVKRVFPDLRLWCEERKIRLIECDLRWGVPKDSTPRDILLSCLSELDRCYDENEHPYFLNLIGERYGWVPTPEQMPEDVKIRYKWLEGMSVTALEIFTGAYWDRNPHALYMLRNPNVVQQAKLSQTIKVYTEKNEKSIESLKILKGKLQEHYPSQVFRYDAHVDKEEEEKLVLSGLDKFGETVLNHFKAAIGRQYPSTNIKERMSVTETMRAEHSNFMMQRSAILLGRDDAMHNIRSYIYQSTFEAVPLVLVGFPGAGKSALIASAAKEASQNAKFKVFYHFVGATPGSTDLYRILTRLWQEIMPPLDHIPDDLETMMRSTHTLFATAANQAIVDGFQSIIIFIDALNQMDDEGAAHRLIWLPRKLPGNVRLVVSTLEGKCLDALRQDTMSEIIVNPLGVKIREKIAQNILAEYNKTLDQEQLKLLVNKMDAGRPLWLTIACEELRVFGEFKQLTQKVRSLPTELTGLLQVVLERIVKEYGGDLVLATLCCIEMSRFGLLETEILELLALHPALPNQVQTSVHADTEPRIPMAKWALVFLGLRQFLRPCGSSGEGRLDFYHRTTSKVVKSIYLGKTSDQNWWHGRLADYFQVCKNIERKAEELPYHLQMIDDKERLKGALVDNALFSELYQESSKQQLMRYWIFIGGYDIAAREYMKALRQYIQVNRLTDIDQIEPIQCKIAWFLVDIGQYEAAQELLEDMLRQIQGRYGSEHRLLANSLHCIVTLLYRKAIQYVYGTHPGYKLCRKLGTDYAAHCIKVHSRYFSIDDPHLGHVFTQCGYFIRSALDDALKIFRRIGDKQGLAQCLYMLGGKNQYNKDMSVPISLFEQGLDLCKTHFGMMHMHTARCCQLYGQMYWNAYIKEKSQTGWILKCLQLYKQELTILEEVMGPYHPTTVRSREDVVIILKMVNRPEESQELQKKQPKNNQALYDGRY